MRKGYIKKFNIESEYLSFIESKYFVTPNVSYVTSTRNICFNYTQDYSKKYFTLTPIEDSTFLFSKSGLSYSLDNGDTWNELSAETDTPTVLAGDNIIFKNNSTLTPEQSGGIGKFSSSKNFDASGNIMSLLFGDNFIGQKDLSGYNYAFTDFFRSSKIVNALDLILPATTLSLRCYSSMFYECDNLITPPNLPATTLASECYSHMFMYCDNLLCPDLPATTLAKNCYNGMFFSCRYITKAPELPAITLAEGCYNSMFGACYSLTEAPELPAITLAKNCYSSMFSNCYKLNKLPSLPATTLSPYCYSEMFINCKITSLLGFQLPATTLAEFCYSRMFEECRDLTTIPSNLLSATTLTESCYRRMFKDCESLATVPSNLLPATTLAGSCYEDMFQGCTSLVEAPELPATTLTQYCYDGMFKDCKYLVDSPILPAIIPESFSYFGMFEGCERLKNVTCFLNDDWKDGCTYKWLKGVDSNGTFIRSIRTTTWELGYGESDLNGGLIPSSWTIVTPELSKPLTFIALQNGTFKFTGNTINYSLDNGNTWNTLASDTNSPTVSAGSKIMWKADLTPTSNGIGKFSSSANFTVEGNIMSLLYSNNFNSQTSLSGKTGVFTSLFENCTTITSAENLLLPALTLEENCYNNMFSNCTNLIIAPALPATTLASYCYSYMFSGCSNLTTTATLPAITLAEYCYDHMFENCSSLTSAPIIKGTTLENNCFNHMFYNCANLNYIKTKFRSEIGITYSNNWMYGVANNGTFVATSEIETYNEWENVSCGEHTYPCNWTLQYDL